MTTTFFDPEAFKNAIFEGANSIATKPWPANQEVICQIRKVSFRHGTIERGERAGQPWVQLVVQLEASPGQLPEGTSSIASTSIMLDLTESGSLAMGEGQNVRLGLLRKAVGLNRPGATFSFGMLEGRMLKALTGTPRVDQSNPEIQYTEIKGFKEVG